MTRTRLALTASILALALVTVGCGDKNAPPTKPAGYSTYDDPTMKFAVRYPKDWKPGISAGRIAAFYSTTEIGDAFASFDPGEQTGAKIEVRAMTGGQKGMEESVSAMKNLYQDPSVVKGPESVQLAGRPATKYTVSFPVNETEYKSERCYVIEGDVVTYFETAVFGKYDDYKAIFDSAAAGFRPGMTAAVQRDSTGKVIGGGDLVDPPSAEMKDFSNSHFSIRYPANFTASPGGKGKLASTQFRGQRVDTYLQVDVDPAQGELQAIVDANKKNFGTPRATTLGGQKAFVFDRSDADATGRFYFCVANNKLYRVTVYWFTAQKDTYMGAFEAMIASFKAK